MEFRLPAELSGALVELGRAHRATLFMTLLAAFQVLLDRQGFSEAEILAKLRARDIESTAEAGELQYMVYSFDVATGRKRVLTADTGTDDASPAYSPDGRFLMFHSSDTARSFNDAWWRVVTATHASWSLVVP